MRTKFFEVYISKRDPSKKIFINIFGEYTLKRTLVIGDIPSSAGEEIALEGADNIEFSSDLFALVNDFRDLDIDDLIDGYFPKEAL